MSLMNRVMKMANRKTSYRSAEEYVEDLQEYCSRLEKQNKYLYERYENLTCDWVRLNKDNKELSCKYDDLNKKCNELLEAFNRNNSEPVEEIMTLDDWLKKEKEEEKNAEE